MRKVLIITYYWPPSGGSAVLRWLKFSKYLRDFGWEPVIYTPENPEPQEIDESLIHEVPENLKVLKTHITEPYNIYKWITGKKQSDRLGVALMTDQKKGITAKFSLWIRSNFFIPDPRFLWIRPSVRYLQKFLKSHPVDIIISTGPPHSMHLIAKRIKRKTGIKWLADFRDPWTNIDFYKDLSLTTWADKYHKWLEKSVLEQADRVITVSNGMTEEFRAMGFNNIVTITNGYDQHETTTNNPVRDTFSITHLGSLPKSRNPENLWKVLSLLTMENTRFAASLTINLVGKTDGYIRESIFKNGLQKYVNHTDFVPHHQTSSILAQSAVLLLCINNTPNARGILTNKFFEYMASQRPILAVGPEDGDAAFILKDTGAGKIFNYTDSDRLKTYIMQLFELYSTNNLQVNSTNIEKYSRKNLTSQLSEVLNILLN